MLIDQQEHNKKELILEVCELLGLSEISDPVLVLISARLSLLSLF